MDIYVLLSVFLGFSALMAFLFKKIGFSHITGYILTGVVLSLIFSERIEASKELLNFFSEVAITLLIFEIGREIGIENIRKIKITPLMILGFEIFFAFVLAILFGILLNLNATEVLILATIASFSSTAIIFKLMEELNFPEEVRRQILTVMVLEDIYAVILLAIIPQFRFEDFGIMEILRYVVFSLFTAFVLIISGITIVNRIFVKIVEPNELGVSIILGSVFLFAIVSKYLGLSPALGAFSAGVALSAHSKNAEIGEYLRPVREIFLILFFVALGTEAGLIEEFNPILLLAPFIVFFRFIAFSSANWFTTGRSLEESLKIGFVASCVGEFGLVITYEATRNGVVGLEFLTLSAFSIILGSIVSSKVSHSSDEYAKKISSLVPSELKVFVDRISVNINRIAEGRTSEVVRDTFFRMIRDVLVLILTILFCSSALYIADHFLPSLSYLLPFIILPLIFFVIFFIGIRTRKYSESLVMAFAEKGGISPIFKGIMTETLFLLLALLSLNLALLLSGRFLSGILSRIYKIEVSPIIFLAILLLFSISIFVIYRRLKRISF